MYIIVWKRTGNYADPGNSYGTEAEAWAQVDKWMFSNHAYYDVVKID